MAKTLQAVLKQIQALEKQAASLKEKEKAGVISRIQEAIAHYGITADELYGKSLGRSAARAPRKVAKKVAADGAGQATLSAGKSSKPAKYTDGNGKGWSGIGKRPEWFKAALAAGKTSDDLLVRA